jgi:hypothetical protein
MRIINNLSTKSNISFQSKLTINQQEDGENGVFLERIIEKNTDIIKTL